MRVAPWHRSAGGWRQACAALAAALLAACAGPSWRAAAGDADDAVAGQPPWLTSKTPYRPRQDPSTYQPVPPGFTPIHTQMVARHGARGLTGMKQELALLTLWQAAAAEAALTPLGHGLGPDLEALIRAHAWLGQAQDVPSGTGYGQLSQLGVAEHQQLARRVLARMPTLFDTAAGSAAPPGRIVVLHSGVDRARGSATAFTRALLDASPALASRVTLPVLRGYPALAPRAQAAGVNRFLLYFHKLNADTDGVGNPADPAYATYQRSLAYQADADNPEVSAKLDEVRHAADLDTLARAVLKRLFTPGFVDKLARGELQSANTGSFEFSSPDGRQTVRLTGDGKTRVQNPLDALMALSAVYEIAPGLRFELAGRDFSRYLPEDAARRLAWVNDAEDFYRKGPGLAERGSINHAMADQLLDDFFAGVPGAAGPGPGAGSTAIFRFTHAEIIVPFASLLRLEGVYVPVSMSRLFQYDSNPWRGENVAPYAANIQWDAWRNAEGVTLVRMLYNERETAFKPECEHARHAPGSVFYELRQLKACYTRR